MRNIYILYIPHLYALRVYTGCMLGAYWVFGCTRGLGRRIAQEDCSKGLLGGPWWVRDGSQLVFLKWRSHMPRTRVSGWDQGFGCWEFSDMAWVIKKWRRGRACRGAARAASVGKCRSRCVRCMCGRAACAVCRRPAWRRGRRARAAHKYRSPAGGLFFELQT